jgi:DNA-binding winged helix-turn-helix (wHTH) protein
MRVNLLGEVTASANGRGSDLLAGLPPQPRLFLAVLAEDAGRAVTAAWLKDRIWGGDLPADPQGQLQRLAALVRSALRVAPEAANVIDASGNGGYRLGLPREAVDACRFRRLAGEARALYERDDDRAVALARAALREWGQ